jgi:hypothetical protein
MKKLVVAVLASLFAIPMTVLLLAGTVIILSSEPCDCTIQQYTFEIDSDAIKWEDNWEPPHRPQKSQIKHLGNYEEDVIQEMRAAATSVGAVYFVVDPHSEACSKPGAICSWEKGVKAFHLEREKLEPFWEEFKNLYCPKHPHSGLCVGFES